jgi:hypothetical protein
MAAIGVFSRPVTVDVVSVCHNPMLTGGVSESWFGACAAAHTESESRTKSDSIFIVPISFASLAAPALQAWFALYHDGVATQKRNVCMLRAIHWPLLFRDAKNAAL